MAVRRYLILACLSAVVVGKVTRTRPCQAAPLDKCTVGEVRIDPCNGRPPTCGLLKHQNASISFDFTPNFSTSYLKTGAYFQGVPFSDLNGNACELTTCPTVPGQQQALNYNLFIGKLLPKGKFNVEWKVWDGENEDDYCCFETSIKLP